MERIQRKNMLPIACGFRIISTVVIQVIIGVFPNNLLIEERKFLDEMGNGLLEVVVLSLGPKKEQQYRERSVNKKASSKYQGMDKLQSHTHKIFNPVHK